MVTKQDIFKFLQDNGIKHDDTVLVHTSMRSLGGVEGGCDGLIDAFKEYLYDGLFIVPTHTWGTVTYKNPVYDVNKTESCLGALPNVAAFRKDGVRSLHPTHSVAAFGKRAAEFVKGEEGATSPCQPGGVWRRLLDENAKILLIGVLLDRCTYIHAVDEMLELGRMAKTTFMVTSIGYNGEKVTSEFRYNSKGASDNFEVYRKPLEYCGALKNAKLGDATVGIFDVRPATEMIKKIISRADYDVYAELKDIPEKFYKD